MTQQTVTTKQIATAAGITPRTKTFTLRDNYGLAYDGGRSEHVLAALSRSDKTNLPFEIHHVARAVYKCLTTGRMRPELANRIVCYSPYKVCALVARIANVAAELTIGELADDWINAHASEL